MEGGGNSKGTGLGGLFGAGGLGYSHADLAGVPREYWGGRRGRPRGAMSAHRPLQGRAAGSGGGADVGNHAAPRGSAATRPRETDPDRRRRPGLGADMPGLGGGRVSR